MSQTPLAPLAPFWKKLMIRSMMRLWLLVHLSITKVMTASESELSSNDQVVSMEVGTTNSAVTQFIVTIWI